MMQRYRGGPADMLSSIYLKRAMLVVIALLLSAAPSFAQSQAAPDEENCLICHRYPALGRYDENGSKRVYYINDQMFLNSVHGKLRCKGCHVDLDKIPHENVKKVDCSGQCHIKEPSSNRDFSHQGMVEKYQKSVHGQGVPYQKRFPEDLPTCTYCHGNRLFTPYPGYWGKSEELSRETLARCQGCHTDKAWAEKMYTHFSDRMRRRRGQNEIVQLCTSCHEDEKKMARHGLEAVSTFKDTFHWTLVKYGVRNAPDCITCHVPVGYTTHTLRPKTDPVSPIYKNNRIKTCSNQGGIQDCHPGATIRFAEGRVHAYGTKVQLMAAKDAIKAAAQQQELFLLVRATEEISQQELFHYKVLSLIKLMYKLIIGLVIGFMCQHQLLVHRRARRNIKKEVIHGER
jgi:hypothetical protein